MYGACLTLRGRLSGDMGTTSNRFDFIRLVLASGVFLFHVVALSAAEQTPLELNLAVLGELCIQGFFIVSGGLVYGSYERSKSLSDYAGKRIRRLYPAYAVVILIPAAIALLMTLAAPGRIPQILEYVGANLLFLNFLEPNLPGLFESNRFPAVNGALWTLKIEVMFYLIVPALAFVIAKLRGRGTAIFLTAIYIAAELWRIGFEASSIMDGAAFAPCRCSFV